jgi:hypothetical protein
MNKPVAGFIEEMESVEKRVEAILTKNLVARDSDMALLYEFWYVHDHLMSALNGGELGFYSWLLNTATSPESIRRSRQKLQEQHPALRGKMWRPRHQEGEAVREQIVHVQTGQEDLDLKPGDPRVGWDPGSVSATVKMDEESFQKLKKFTNPERGSRG